MTIKFELPCEVCEEAAISITVDGLSEIRKEVITTGKLRGWVINDKTHICRNCNRLADQIGSNMIEKPAYMTKGNK